MSSKMARASGQFTLGFPREPPNSLNPQGSLGVFCFLAHMAAFELVRSSKALGVSRFGTGFLCLRSWSGGCLSLTLAVYRLYTGCMIFS